MSDSSSLFSKIDHQGELGTPVSVLLLFLGLEALFWGIRS